MYAGVVEDISCAKVRCICLDKDCLVVVEVDAGVVEDVPRVQPQWEELNIHRVLLRSPDHQPGKWHNRLRFKRFPMSLVQPGIADCDHLPLF